MSAAKSVAELVVEFLTGHGVDRVFGLQGGHIQPIWDFLARRGVRIVDVRDEGAAVHMAHAHAALGGGFGVALVTAGPGVTNCVTAMANAQLERVPVLLIGGCAPVAQDDLGPLQGIAHVDIMRPVTRLARTLRVADNVLRDLDKALATALGDGTVPGPAYVEIPTDVLRETVPPAIVLDEYLAARPRRRLPPDPAEVARAARMIDEATRPLVMTGRGAQGAARELVAFLDRTGAVYLDTQESRGLVPADHAAMVGAMRGRAMQEADLVVVIGRKLDYQMAYGSPAVFGKARFLRIADNWEELRENRRGEVELMADPALALAALAQAVRSKPARLDAPWTSSLRSEHERRSARYAESLASVPAGKDGHMHPNRIFAALAKALKPDAITIADGGDILSFARMGLPPRTYLDSGTFGCLGVGIPYGIAAALLHPDRQVAGRHRRRRVRHQRDGDRLRQAPRCESRLHRRQQRRLEHRAARPGDELRRPRRRHDAAMVRLRGDGARVRPARRARHRSRAARRRPCRRVRERARAPRRRRDARRAVLRRGQGARLGADLPGAHRMGRRRARAAERVTKTRVR